jgi:hypothetical protein
MPVNPPPAKTKAVLARGRTSCSLLCEKFVGLLILTPTGENFGHDSKSLTKFFTICSRNYNDEVVMK